MPSLSAVDRRTRVSDARARRGLLSAAAILAVLVLVLAGCGGGGSSTGASNASFAKAADQVCAAVNKRVAKLARPKSASESLVAVQQQQRLREEELASLRAVTAPTAQVQRYGEYLSGLAAENTLGKTDYEDIKAGQEEKLAAVVVQGSKLTEKLAREAKALGLKDCATNPYGGT
jgi:hypothetical protein